MLLLLMYQTWGQILMYLYFLCIEIHNLIFVLYLYLIDYRREKFAKFETFLTAEIGQFSGEICQFSE